MYPETPGYQAHSRTSQAAAESINTESMENFIVCCLSQCGKLGATADELQQLVMREWPTVQAGTVAARLRGIELKGWAVRLDETRETRAGKAAFVWVHLPHIDGRQLAPKKLEFARPPLEAQLIRDKATLELRLESALVTIESQAKELEKLRGSHG